MKTYILIGFLSCICKFTSAQFIHSFSDVLSVDSQKSSPPKNNQWYKKVYPEMTIYMQTFNLNPIGAKKAIDLSKQICQKNGVDFKEPDKDESYLASYVESIESYEDLHLSVQSGSSIVEKLWYKFSSTNKLSVLRLKLEEDSYILSISYMK